MNGARCVTCGRVGGDHNRLTHRNQELLEWWPLWRAESGKVMAVNRAEDVPERVVSYVEGKIERQFESISRGSNL